MAQYMLALYEDPSSFTGLSPEEMQAVIQEYSAWAEELRSQGRLVGNNKLADDGGKVLRSEGGKVRVLDGPFSETKEVIGGYFIVEAADYEEAAEIARGCPHLRYGGAIELRAIDRV